MEEFVEFENAVTGRTRKFPRSIFNCLGLLCLDRFPTEERLKINDHVMNMIAQFLDSDRAEPLRMAAAAMYPEMEGIRLNAYSPEIIKAKLGAWANTVFARYGHPVWLVGSALDGAGRDVDIRVILPDSEFNSRFPDAAAYGLEIGKQGRHASLFGRMNVDFQIQKFSETGQYDGRRCMRIDTCTYPEAYIPPSSLGMG